MRDAWIQPATAEQVALFANQRGVGEAAARETLERLRERQVLAQREDPYVHGYEPPIWFVVKSLMRDAHWSGWERAQIRRRLGEGWTAEAFAEQMRTRLGFAYPVTKILIMGANRSGKTDFAAKVCMQVAASGGKFVGSGAQTHKTQKQNQMARVWNYMPNAWKAKNVATRKAKDVVENISYTPKNGFAGSRVTFDNGSVLNFVTYEQNIAALEGTEYDFVHLDEEYGIEYYNLMTTRITSRAGTFLGTFTPLHGYTPQVAKFLNDRVVTRWHAAYLRPTDGGRKLPWLELNLTEEEYARLTAWRREGMQGDCGVRESVPEDCFGWLFDEGEGRTPSGMPSGRAFDFTPRVCVCQGGQAAAVWFYGSDNPYGLPSELILTKMADENAEQRIYESVYGMAREMKGRIFKTFRREANVVSAAELPDRLVRFMVVDPAPERNWCMAWFGYDPVGGVLYVYREWPGNYEIPGQGVPGAWVVPSDRNGGRNDGARGDGQSTFGFGYDHIKFEIARLEGWADFRAWAAANGAGGRMPDDMTVVEDWDETDGAEETMAFRLLDSRAASQSKISRGTSQTLLEDLEGMLGGWQVADGQRCDIGYSTMIDRFASGRLKVVESCTNTIDCLEMLTGADGQKGAAKDFVDLVRYAVMSDIWGYGAADAAAVRGGARGGAEAAAERPSGHRGRRKAVWW